jgi:phage shock protein C
MYCSQCGTQMQPGARFCSSCGTAYSPTLYTGVAAPVAGAPVPSPTPMLDQLTRPLHPRVIAGVCSGLALHYGWSVILVRLLWVLCVIFFGTGLLAYLIAWIVIPASTYELPQPGSGYSA